MHHTTKPFQIRAFVTLMLTLAGLGLPVTGIANHYLGFSPLTSERHVWMAAHNALGLLFVAFSLWHVGLNRRALWNHIKMMASGVPAIRREALLAALIMLLATLFISHGLLVGA
ncbi:MAG: DUF4405 domain-containing protein [Solidesulfovibrio sp.]